MSGTEIDRLEIITRAAARELRQSVAAERLSLSLRQSNDESALAQHL